MLGELSLYHIQFWISDAGADVSQIIRHEHFSLVMNCHSKRKLRELAAADAEAAIAAQINRALEKEAKKEDPPPEYELPPTYMEAMQTFKLDEQDENCCKSSSSSQQETDLDLSLNRALKKQGVKTEPSLGASSNKTDLIMSKVDEESSTEVKLSEEIQCHL